MKKGDHLHLRVSHPIINSIIVRKAEFGDNVLDITYQDGTKESIPLHMVHHIYRTRNAYVVHTFRKSECARHKGVYKGSKQIGPYKYLAFQLDGDDKMTYFLEDYVTATPYEETFH